MTKKFGVDGAFRYGSAVDGDELAVFAAAELVNNFGKRFFTTSAFTSNQHGHVRWGDLGSHLDGMIEFGTIANDAEALFDA